ncbi:hypothetical protein J0A68_13860 [Algoriphagus sp. H41]|uniref:SPOR domain-containing protein n=1 Tax=Algoriphagus oliviformis TaxID=2811231 RepID=A0ABS3C4I4_9BACT|nr:hypothetical protein [Algoriphagus oliviformis]MBN7812033.1 hypothetical protein [Algoriphagus oliviformis]
MSAKDSESKQWSDPKDFGLPFVEISPLKPKLEAKELISSEVLASGEEHLEEEPKAGVAESEPASVPTETPAQAVQPKTAPPAAAASKDGEKSSSWAWAVLLIGLGIVTVIVWQILENRKPAVSETIFEVVEQDSPQSEPVASQSPAETTAAGQNQEVVNQDSIATSTISNPNISKPAETGTTIANTASGNLIRVESKGERPQYFIIVGSLPNEKMAIEEASQYFAKNAELYLITPYDGGSNYRLALSRFASFRLAAEKLEELKSQYSEELWILKY